MRRVVGPCCVLCVSCVCVTHARRVAKAMESVPVAGEENERDRGLRLSQGRVDLAQLGRRRRVDVGHHHDHVHVLSNQWGRPHSSVQQPATPDTA